MIRNEMPSAEKGEKKDSDNNDLSSNIEEIIRQIDTRNDALKKIYEFFKKDEPGKKDRKK
ncbi:MAG: hypothetical protein EA393_12755 [Bacteroidetes bacterium]|nr:MAG: hypothetical protein EA393_12755 [Bacteroidota bacterium]